MMALDIRWLGQLALHRAIGPAWEVSQDTLSPLLKCVAMVCSF